MVSNSSKCTSDVLAAHIITLIVIFKGRKIIYFEFKMVKTIRMCEFSKNNINLS